MARETFTSERIGPPVGPFSQAVRGGEGIYLSGQVGHDPATGRLVEGGVAAQAEQALRNLAPCSRPPAARWTTSSASACTWRTWATSPR
ncbi:2-iminobutanoate/2-iminopropanoate deaminase [bacterium JGI 053]|nr:2-iminobutanoate/2-iminopropanoate deaminase [bacterium JGI 053]